MPSIATLLAHPERRRPSPPPPHADLRTVFQLGMTFWAIALVVSLVLALAGSGDPRVIATCVVGLGLGGLGLLWARRHPDEAPPEEPAAGAVPTEPESTAEAAEEPEPAAPAVSPKPQEPNAPGAPA